MSNRFLPKQLKLPVLMPPQSGYKNSDSRETFVLFLPQKGRAPEDGSVKPNSRTRSLHESEL
jgi:hypothetical protein